MNKNDFFYLRDLKISHTRSTMPIGTDSLLLGCWANIDNRQRILEVGTGCGIISLVLARNSKKGTRIDALDIDRNSIKEAKENVNSNHLENTISVIHVPFQKWKGEKYDTIISNPPFFQNSIVNELENRRNARHQQELNMNELIEYSLGLLNPNGSLQLIYPSDSSPRFIEYASSQGFSLIRKTSFIPKMGGRAKRHLLEFIYGDRTKPFIEDEIIQYDHYGQLHQSMKNLFKKIKPNI